LGDGRVAVGVAVNDALVDDFEDGDNQTLRIGGRQGTWFSFNDGSSGVQFPPPNVPLLPVPEGAGGGFVLHTVASGFPNFGTGTGATLVVPNVGYDASRYKGVRFSYKSGDFTSARFAIGTRATTPPPEGTCDQSSGACFDDFQFSLVLFPSDAFTTV